MCIHARFRTSRYRSLTTPSNDHNLTEKQRNAETKPHQDAHRLSEMQSAEGKGTLWPTLACNHLDYLRPAP
jgi:hypothetical protein